MREPSEIVADFIANGYAHLPVLGNRVFYYDLTVSTLVYTEGRVVIEYYMLLPNVHVQMHSHPFENQMIFISGQLTARRSLPSGRVVSKTFTDTDYGYLGSVLPAGLEHGFDTGPDGAIIYNIQIWPDEVANPLSAAIEFLGPSMGPVHEAARLSLGRL